MPRQPTTRTMIVEYVSRGMTPAQIAVKTGRDREDVNRHIYLARKGGFLPPSPRRRRKEVAV